MGKLVGPGLVMNQATNDSVADQHKTKGSGMIPIYRDRAKEREEWACVKCGEISHSDHAHGPNNGVCQCTKTFNVGGEPLEKGDYKTRGTWVSKGPGRSVYYPESHSKFSWVEIEKGGEIIEDGMIITWPNHLRFKVENI